MCCLWSFSILDLLLALEVRTDESIAAGREELSKFGDLMKVCRDIYFCDSMMLTFTRTIFNYLQICQFIVESQWRTGTFPNCMHWCTALMMLWQKVSQGTTTLNQMRSFITLSRKLICEPTLRMLPLKWVACTIMSGVFVLISQHNRS